MTWLFPMDMKKRPLVFGKRSILKEEGPKKNK
jgi:hypothetical protein